LKCRQRVERRNNRTWNFVEIFELGLISKSLCFIYLPGDEIVLITKMDLACYL